MRLGKAQNSKAPGQGGRARGSLALGLLLVLVTAAATYLVATRLAPTGVRAALREVAEAGGLAAFVGDESLPAGLLALPARWAGASAPPELVLDVPFEHMRKLYAQREAALARGQLIQGDDDFVPARLRHDGRTTKVKIRLKGDQVDHFESDKWSFRVHVKGDDHVFGMRRFSLQHPKARGFQAELLFLETMRRQDVLAPRVRTVDLTVNGNHVGVMTLEEHFAKELLESNRRRDSVIVKLDEDLVWAARDGLREQGFGAGAFDSFRNAPISAFGEGRIGRSPLLSAYATAATGLLRGFVEERLPASQVFDVERLGRFLAVCQLWGAWHAVRWHNLRFAYDPYGARLEPVAFDASLRLVPSEGARAIDSEPIVQALLSDPKVFHAYEGSLRRLLEDARSGALIEALRDTEGEHLPLLHKEFRFLSEYPLDRLRSRAEAMSQLSEADLRAPRVVADWYPVLVQARIVREGGDERLEVANAIPYEVEIRDVAWQGHAAAPLTGSTPFPLRLAPTARGAVAAIWSRPLRRPPDAPDAVLELEVGVRGARDARRVEVPIGRPSLARRPIPWGDVGALVAKHPFVVRGEAGLLRIQPGTHDLAGAFIVPPGHRLVAGPGTTLRFAPGAVLVSHGPVAFEGVEGQEVVLQARSPSEGWGGLAVLDAGEASILAHVRVRHTTGVELGDWRLTGGVNFLRSDLTARHVRIEGSRGEDALNVVGARFELEDVWFQDTRSDAFDADFCKGSVRGGRFLDIGLAGGGDAIDVSGSDIDVDGVRFERVGDKGLSVGEASQMRARGVVMHDVGAGAVVKDGSRLELATSEINDARVAALMAYVKKPEYGPGVLEARDVTLSGLGAQARAQTGSSITIDAVAVESEPLDVEELYASSMKKAGSP